MRFFFPVPTTRCVASVVGVLLAVLLLNMTTTVTAHAQTNIFGVLVDSYTREPLQGARILVVEANAQEDSKTKVNSTKTNSTQRGVVSDMRGNFTIENVNPSDALYVSLAGYQKKKFSVSSFTPEQLASRVVLEVPAAVVTAEQVAITASRAQQLRSEMPVAISVVGKQLIEDTKPVALPEVMNKVAGVVMPNLMNEQHSMSIRAPLNTRPIYLYMEDGIAIRSTGVFNHNALIEVNLPAVRAIEIVKGPGSALYGSNAVSGAINFLTQRASAIPMLELGLQTDNYTYRRANLSAGNTFGNLGLYVGGYYARQTDTWREHSAMEKFSLNVRGDYRVDDKTTLEALFTTNNLDTDVNHIQHF